MPNERSDNNEKIQMRKGVLEFCILLITSKRRVYASDILQELLQSELLVVEGTLYPLLNRLRRESLLQYEWVESSAGPPRKYYSITPEGKKTLSQHLAAWNALSRSVTTLLQRYE